MGRKRYCELPFCKGVVEGTRNKRRCDNDRNIHLHQVISRNVRKIMRFIQGHEEFTANDVTQDLFKDKLDKNEKGSMYRLFQAMVREHYLLERGKREGLKVYAFSGTVRFKSEDDTGDASESDQDVPVAPPPTHETHHDSTADQLSADNIEHPSQVRPTPVQKPHPIQEPLSPLSRQELLLGKLREFVYLKNGNWNHEDWMWLINRSDIREFGESESEIGRILEEEKNRFWARRS
ncbi:MAG: hypothetical protein HQM09_07450 [Candidatus Riflebacteria bacterium]|nr:hypothetical protein [Candidatus Riflebacteria bacterium]